MKKIVQAWTGISLVQRIVAGLVIGALLGMFVPSEGGIAILGDVFVGALKAIAPLLVFFLVISSLCYAGKSHGGVIRTVIIPCSYRSSYCKQCISCNTDTGGCGN